MAGTPLIPTDAVWFITGSSSGIGKAFAEQISKHGSYRLIASARKISDMDYLPNSLNIHKTVLDITQPESMKLVLTEAVEIFGRIDVVVNVVGSSLFGDFEATPDDKARAQLELNFWGAANLLRETLRIMREENPKSGRIGGVFCQVSGVSGRVAYPGGTYYIASRFAWEGLVKSLSKELRPEWNINLMTVHPQAVQTDYLKKSITLVDRHPAYEGFSQGTESWLGALTQHLDLTSFGTPEQLVGTISKVIEKGVPGQGIPLQLPAGGDSWHLIEKSLEKEQRLLREQKEIACTAAPEDQKAPHIEMFI